MSNLANKLAVPLASKLAVAIAAEIGGFSPTSLFADGSKGVVYDNNDLSSFYLDSAGATPATVNGLVGLQLDSSLGATLGAELTTNGGFDSDTWWTKSDVTVTISGGTGNFTASTAGQAIFRSSLFVIGGYYEITYTVTSVSAGGVRLHDGSNFGPTRSVPGTYTERWLTIGPNFFIIATGASTTASIDNVSVKRVLGNHRYQTTTGSKPILRGTPTGANLVTNGGFDSSTGWTLNGAVSISAGKGRFNSASTGNNLQWTGNGGTSGLVVGKVYLVQYTIESISSGAIRSFAGAGGVTRTTAGTYIDYITAANTELYFGVVGGTATTAVVDNVSVHDVSAGSVTAPYGLQYDGVDDFMQTAAVDFTATDKMFVCAGVRKLSDAAVGRLVEFSASVAANTGSFGFSAPASVAANYEFRCGGSIRISTGYTNSLVAAPNTAVLTGIGDIAGDNVQISTNGVLRASANNDQGTGTCGNYPFYFGRRGGTVDPYNGLDFGMVICGKTLTSTQISSTERYIAQRTGISL